MQPLLFHSLKKSGCNFTTISYQLLICFQFLKYCLHLFVRLSVSIFLTFSLGGLWSSSLLFSLRCWCEGVFGRGIGGQMLSLERLQGLQLLPHPLSSHPCPSLPPLLIVPGSQRTKCTHTPVQMHPYPTHKNTRTQTHICRHIMPLLFQKIKSLEVSHQNPKTAGSVPPHRHTHSDTLTHLCSTLCI